MSKIIKLLIISFVLPTIFLTQSTSALFGDTSTGNSGACIRLTSPLTYGNRDTQSNSDVTTLQTFLYNNGYLTVNPTGFFGTNTRKAVKDFQSEVLSNVQIDNIDSSIITSSSDRNELVGTGFRLSNTGYVGMYTRAKLAYVTCGGGDNLNDSNGSNNGSNTGNNSGNNGGNVSGGGILEGSSSCVVPTYDSSSISNSSASANGTCELTLTWPGATEPLSSKLIKWQLEGSDFWSGNITLADDSLVSKSKKFILGQNNMTVAISSNGQNISTKVISSVCASGAERDASNGRCVISNSQLGSSLAIITTSLPNVAIGAAYTYPIISTGGTGTRDWNVTSGVLPTGLYLNKIMCMSSNFGGCSQGTSIGLGGTATNAGTYTFTITATAGTQSVSKQFTITVGASSNGGGTSGNGGVLAITTTSLVHARAINAYNYEQMLTYSGGTGSPTWSLVSGALPGGMVLNPTTGIIKTNIFPQPNGPIVGLYNFTIGLTVGSQNVTKQLSIDIISSTDPKPVLSDLKYSAYKDAYLSVVGDHSVNIKGTLGFSGNETCSMVDGLLPDGVSFDATNCKIIGIPRATGTFTMTLKVQNQYGSDTAKVILEITNPARIRILTGSLPDAMVGQPYNVVVNFQADPGIVGMYQSGDRIILPDGLSYVYTTGELSAVIRGTPTTAGTYQVPISVAAGGNTNIGETKIFNLLVKPQ